jgi:hypothetical protein
MSHVIDLRGSTHVAVDGSNEGQLGYFYFVKILERA